MLLDAVEWLGHSGFRVRVGSSTVYIDPYRAPDGPQADAILITHGHYDHFSPRDVERLRHERTVIAGPPAVAERAPGRAVSLWPGEALELDGVRGVEVRAVAAYNTSKVDASGTPFHPREAGGLGYELNVRGERLYHSGDTDVIPEMDAVQGVDVALLAVSGVYVMTAEEAAEAARRIAPATAVPMHWGDVVGTEEDARKFAARAPVPVRVMLPVGRDAIADLYFTK
jgi:L-ascorbate metabolism protein UlaG (beta-lactamase superfamily)